MNNNVTYFDSSGVEHIPKETKKFIGSKNTMGSTITKNIFRIQPYDSVMCLYFCTGFSDFMLEDKSVIDFTNLFSPNDFKMVEYNSPNIYRNLNDQQQVRLNKINEIKNYFVSEIKGRKLMSERISKYIAFLTILINL